MAELSRLPRAVNENWDWQVHAACRGMNSSVFFHPESERGDARAQREARAIQICRSCPVITQCREHALSVQEPYGIWGGLGQEELRRRIAARRWNRRT